MQSTLGLCLKVQGNFMACLKCHQTLQEIDNDHEEIIANAEATINAGDVACSGIILERSQALFCRR